jgi:hypothetical protein
LRKVRAPGLEEAGFETKTPSSSSKSSLAVGGKVNVGWKSEADGRGEIGFGAEVEGELVLETELEKVSDRGKFELEGDGALWAVPVFMEMGDKERGVPEGNATRNMPFGRRTGVPETTIEDMRPL